MVLPAVAVTAAEHVRAPLELTKTKIMKSPVSNWNKLIPVGIKRNVLMVTVPALDVTSAVVRSPLVVVTLRFPLASIAPEHVEV